MSWISDRLPDGAGDDVEDHSQNKGAASINRDDHAYHIATNFTVSNQEAELRSEINGGPKPG